MIKLIRDKLITILRDFDDKIYEGRETQRILFVVNDGYGFSCQAPVISSLIKSNNVIAGTTTDKDRNINDIDFTNEEEENLFISLYQTYRKARIKKWHIIVSTHVNGFYPARRALKAYMHHGPGFGILGNKIAIAEQFDVFLGLSMTEMYYFEKLKPGLFNEQRLFFPTGFPKSDNLANGVYNRKKTLELLDLKVKPTILITSHWRPCSNIFSFQHRILAELAEKFPSYNIIQTGHPWLWEPNREIDKKWQVNLIREFTKVEQKFSNAKFYPTSDVEPLLNACDLLVADHSSVMTTYCILDKPIVYYDDPEMEFAIKEFKLLFQEAGHTFRKIDELSSVCQNAINNPDSRAEGRKILRMTFNNNIGCSAEMTANFLKKLGTACNTKSKKWKKIQNSLKNYRMGNS